MAAACRHAREEERSVKPLLLLLTAGGLGRLRPAPGTWGSTPPVLLALGLVAALSADGLSGGETAAVNAGLVVLGMIFATVCIAGGPAAERHFGGKDPGAVVADEVAGQSLPLLGLPWVAMTDAASVGRNAMLSFVAFAAFRIFDISKPPPARNLERLPAGWGILVDDLVAGLYAVVVTQLVVRLALPGVLVGG
ncbi:MAG: phosphatidylglycerophosphatase A [Phycisphaerales bacterium]|nr:phosphatidylglycerophosphatase A [Phycisphaerae bacterium]NNF44354.1 phosphatidylglycerophosphatase A [Phycisphaerales bacterium]NNM27066.1 phosphatidylglycerophosphatase A [Phycisphaerales bacterium]